MAKTSNAKRLIPTHLMFVLHLSDASSSDIFPDTNSEKPIHLNSMKNTILGISQSASYSPFLVLQTEIPAWKLQAILMTLMPQVRPRSKIHKGQ